MMSNLIFQDIKYKRKCVSKVKKLYNKAFPKDEKVPFTVLKLNAKKDRARFYGIYDGDTFVGLIYNIFYKDIVYIFYFAISEELRNKGYGSKVLEEIKEKYKEYRIILMMEEINQNSNNYKERIKRRDFYYKNAFRNFNYKIKEAGVTYEMLGYSNENKSVSREEYKGLMRNYWGEILYKCVYEKYINKDV